MGGGGGRGGFGGGMGGPGNFGGGGGGGGFGGQGMGNAAGRQIYVSNVCHSLTHPLIPCTVSSNMTANAPAQLPYTVGWQDLKDLFRQAGKKSLNAEKRWVFGT
jgi:hypothetical protein